MKRSPDTTKQVAIIGGGISGLAAAYFLQEKARALGFPLALTLFESAPRLGGKILTENTGEFIVEGGPDSFLLQKPWAAQLAQDLGLESELIGTNPEPKKLFVVNHGRLTPMPDGVMLVIPTRFTPFITSALISWPGKIRMGMDLFIPPRAGDEDESIGNFIRRRLGREALEKLAEPLLSGIHVSDPEQQSLLGTFPRFRTTEKQHGSLIRGMLAQRWAAHPNGKGNGGQKAASWRNSIFVSLKGGMGRLVQALEGALDQGRILTGCRVTNLLPSQGGYRITTEDGQSMQVDTVVLAAPAYISSELVSPFMPELSRGLASIRYVSTATVSLAYRRQELGQTLNGVGFIVPRKEARTLTACTFSSAKFSGRAPQDHLLLRGFVGGPGHEPDVERSDEEIVARVRTDLAALMGIQAEPAIARVYRWIKGNPQYDVGHLERVSQMHALCAGAPGLFLTGQAYEGIGVPDCVRQGQQAAEGVMDYFLQKEKLAASQSEPGG